MNNLFLSIVFGLISIVYTNAQDFDCKLTNEKAKGPVIAIADNTLKSGIRDSVAIYFRMPANSSEINRADWINCKGYLPDGAEIINIVIVTVEGLPTGLKSFFNKDSRLYDGGESGCATLKGIVLEAGVYPITVNMKGAGSMYGIKKNYECWVSSFEIIVE